jgi:hypothetical protein
MPEKRGSLIVVGAGIKAIAHLTVETCGWIQRADIVLYCVADPISQAWIEHNAVRSLDLYQFYDDGLDRNVSYEKMTDCILRHVRQNLDVCVVYYGHPGVFVAPSHAAMRIAKSEGYETAMLPGISAEDYLFAEIGFDPSVHGYMAFEATDMLLRGRTLCPDSHVVIWQVGCLGDMSFKRSGYNTPYVPLLIRYLRKFYPGDHEIFHYQGSQYSTCPSHLEIVRIDDLESCTLNGISTLYLPPVVLRPIDEAMAEQLGFRVQPGKDEGGAQPVVAAASGAATQAAELPVSFPPTPAVPLLAHFLEEMANDPYLLAEFSTNPEETTARHAAGLLPHEREAVLSRHCGMMTVAARNGAHK